MTAVSHRRALHQIPELDRELPQTLAYVRGVLEELPCTVFSPTPGSVCAFFDAGKEETVAFRADMDALPVEEETGLPYASRHPGKMHACGHDGHTAMLLDLARRAAERKDQLPRNVLAVFQPAEETTGGAEALCQSGVLEEHRVKRIFGLHLWPGLPAGTVWSRPGPLMARSSEVSLHVTGKGVHISRAEEGRDALWAACRFLQEAYRLAQELPGQRRVLRFGRMDSGSVRNAVSDRTELLGSLRSFDDATFEAMKAGLQGAAAQVAEETGCRLDLNISSGYPPVSNDPELYQAICAALGEEAPGLVETPALAAEDFSFYQRQVPGVFFWLGVGDTPELHAPNFAFDDELVLPRGADFLEKLMLLP